MEVMLNEGLCLLMPVSKADWHSFCVNEPSKASGGNKKSRPSAAGIADDEPTWTYLRRVCGFVTAAAFAKLAQYLH